jgi:hypothetical protein
MIGVVGNNAEKCFETICEFTFGFQSEAKTDVFQEEQLR